MRADVTFDHPRLGFSVQGAEYHVDVVERYEAYRGATGPAGRRFIGVTASVRVDHPELSGRPLEAFSGETFKVLATTPVGTDELTAEVVRVGRDPASLTLESRGEFRVTSVAPQVEVEGAASPRQMRLF